MSTVRRLIKLRRRLIVLLRRLIVLLRRLTVLLLGWRWRILPTIAARLLLLAVLSVVWSVLLAGRAAAVAAWRTAVLLAVSLLTLWIVGSTERSIVALRRTRMLRLMTLTTMLSIASRCR
jgi:hypothetical protein